MKLTTRLSVTLMLTLAASAGITSCVSKGKYTDLANRYQDL